MRTFTVGQVMISTMFGRTKTLSVKSKGLEQDVVIIFLDRIQHSKNYHALSDKDVAKLIRDEIDSSLLRLNMGSIDDLEFITVLADLLY